MFINICKHYRQIFIFFILVFLAACATTTLSNKVQKASAHYKIGLSYYNENKIQKAYIEFQKALELNPKDKEAINAIGILHLLQFEDYNKAIEYFKEALKIDPDFSEALNNIGVAYEKTGKIDDAIESYKKAIANPMYQNPEKAFYNLGKLYYRQGQYDSAIDAFKGALRRVNNYYLSFYGLALCYNAKGYYGDASTALERAIELDPVYKGDRDKALKDFEDKKLLARGDDVRDILDYIEILQY